MSPNKKTTEDWRDNDPTKKRLKDGKTTLKIGNLEVSFILTKKINDFL